MARGLTHVLGLDIGKSAIKAVELRRAGSGVEVLGLPVVLPTPERTIEGGVIVDAAAIARTLLDVIAIGGFKTRKTICSVGGDSSVVVRITEVPKMTGKELEEAIQWELDRQTPFPVDQTIYDYAPILPPDADPNAQNMEVLIAVAQEDMINAHMDAIQGAKLVPEAVDVEPLAICRAIVDIDPERSAPQTIGIVHMGATQTQIIVVRKGLLAFVRAVPTAGDTLTQSIQQNFMGDEKLSEQVKRQFADLGEDLYAEGAAPLPAARAAGGADDLFADHEEMDSVFELSDAGPIGHDEPLDDAGATQLDTAIPTAAELPQDERPQALVPPSRGEMTQDEIAARQIVYEAIAPPMVDLATEVRRSIDFYRRQHRNEEVDRIVLSGGSAVMPGLAQFIESETGIRTEVANPFAKLQVPGDHVPAQYLADIGPAMVVAVGLALRDMVEA